MKLERQRDNQSWIFDWMVKETGRTHNFAYGRELPSEVKSYKMIPRIMERYGRHAEELGRAAEKAGHRETALELYTRAMHPYHIGRTQPTRTTTRRKSTCTAGCSPASRV